MSRQFRNNKAPGMKRSSFSLPLVSSSLYTNPRVSISLPKNNPLPDNVKNKTNMNTSSKDHTTSRVNDEGDYQNSNKNNRTRVEKTGNTPSKFDSECTFGRNLHGIEKKPSTPSTSDFYAKSRDPRLRMCRPLTTPTEIGNQVRRPLNKSVHINPSGFNTNKSLNQKVNATPMKLLSSHDPILGSSQSSNIPTKIFPSGFYNIKGTSQSVAIPPKSFSSGFNSTGGSMQPTKLSPKDFPSIYNRTKSSSQVFNTPQKSFPTFYNDGRCIRKLFKTTPKNFHSFQAFKRLNNNRAVPTNKSIYSHKEKSIGSINGLNRLQNAYVSMLSKNKPNMRRGPDLNSKEDLWNSYKSQLKDMYKTSGKKIFKKIHAFKLNTNDGGSSSLQKENSKMVCCIDNILEVLY
ncbi:hypothetical protein BDF14DRAFT_624301 [Spinellus fusiger]|nr:hypothetical protein BDF14DRAFT_624301 [Spinellus fusiger]